MSAEHQRLIKDFEKRIERMVNALFQVTLAHTLHEAKEVAQKVLADDN